MIEEIWQRGGNNEILTLPRIPSGRAHFSQFILSITLLQRFCADINEKLCGKLIIRLDLTAAAYFSWQRQSLAAVNIRVV